MAQITVSVDEEFVDMLASAIAIKSLAQAGMLAPDYLAPGEPVSAPVPAPVGQQGYAPPGQPADPWAASGPASAPAPPMPAPGVKTVQTRNGAQSWTFSPPGGPLCQCNEPAAFVRGTTSKGAPYSAYRCAKGAGDNWRNKCEFNSWA